METCDVGAVSNMSFKQRVAQFVILNYFRVDINAGYPMSPHALS